MTISKTLALAAGVVLFGISSVTDAATFKVDCDKNGGPSIQDRHDNNAGGGDTILVSGNCSENVTINKDAIRLVAVAGGASIDGPLTTRPTIRVRGSRVFITGFTLTGGSNVIQVQNGGSVTIEGNTISGADRTSAILVTQNSYAQIGGDQPSEFNTIFTNSNARFGIIVRLGSGADVFNNTITGSAGGLDTGISSSAGGTVDMSDNTIEDMGRGLSLSTNASANLSSSLATLGGANEFLGNVIDVRCSLGGALSANSSVSQISNHPNIGTSNPNDANDTNVERFGSCAISSSLSFVAP